MAEILSGFPLMPRLVMMHPRSLTRGTPKVHFFGFYLMLKCLRLVKVSSRSGMRPSPCQVYDDVNDMDLQITLDLSLKAGLHTPLVGGPRVI
jgi:hypothetical protein